ncbi:hypothetical protein EDC01DRAFT_777202 [Geopyxis carbonaria]|nr:hypothetical protein EDC01DRAFT_777202 [Geopyxis carbonaria]
MASKRASDQDPKTPGSSKKSRQMNLRAFFKPTTTPKSTSEPSFSSAADSEPETSPYFARPRPSPSQASSSRPQPSPSRPPSSISRETSTASYITTDGEDDGTTPPRTLAPAPAVPATPSWCRAIRPHALNRRHHSPKHAEVALETLHAIPLILARTPKASPTSNLYAEYNDTNPGVTSHWRLSPRFSPRLPRTRIRVVNADTLDCAATLLAAAPAPVCVLNMANRRLPGGGWLEGATAQEEQLCLRSTLARTLDPALYPLPRVSAVFSPAVAVFRTGSPDYVVFDPALVVGVLSAAALDLRGREEAAGEVYERVWERECMRDKIRHVLRVAARQGQRRLVLGAFGCGAFLNPPKEVARLFKAVLEEVEFDGVGWWQEMVFAIYEGNSGKTDENLRAFREVLEGMEV